MPDASAPSKKRPWAPESPDRLYGRGHPVGDFLEAYEWRVLSHAPGRYEIEAHLPAQVKNPRGVLFGGFTATYIDLVAVRTAHSLGGTGIGGMITANMRVDYLEPVGDERFRMESRVMHSRGRTHLVEVAMKSLDGRLLTLSLVTLRARESQR